MPIFKILTAEEISKFKEVQLKNPEIFAQVENTVKEVEYSHESGECFEIYNSLVKLFEKYSNFITEEKEFYKKYQNLILRLEWNSLPSLFDNEIEELFRKNLLFGIGLQIDLKSKLESFFNIYADDMAGGGKRMLVIRGLKANEEKVGENKLEIEGLPGLLLSQVKNWLLDYDRSAEMIEKVRGELEEVTYLNSSPNVKKINKEQRELLLKILSLYDFLRFPRLAEGVVTGTGHEVPLKPIIKESVKPTTAVVKKEILAKTRKGKETLVQPNEILAAYAGDPKFSQKVTKEEEWLKKNIKEDNLKLREEFYLAVQNQDVPRTIAALRQIVKLNDLEKFLAEDEKINKFLMVVFEKKYGKETAQDFKNQPAALRFLKLFLQYVLQERLGLSESETARIGLQLANLFKQQGRAEYEKLAYYDAKERGFKWFG